MTPCSFRVGSGKLSTRLSALRWHWPTPGRKFCIVITRSRASFGRGEKLKEVFPGVHAYGPEFLGHRLNVLPGMAHLQCRMLADQVTSLSSVLGLRDPVFVYPHLENFTPLCSEMKRRGFPLVHLCIDYPEPYQEVQISIADRCLTVPPQVFEALRERHGEKVSLIPQLYYDGEEIHEVLSSPDTADFLQAIPHPRLTYLGPASNRLDLLMIEPLLREHPDWQMITFGREPCLSLPNVHVLPWADWQNIPSIVASSDIGFMPYECLTQKNLQCVPLKLFDYFAAGLPVVSTPITYVRTMSDLVYIGDSRAALGVAISRALAEPKDSPLRERREQIARKHAISTLACELAELAGLNLHTRGTPPANR